MTSIVFLKEEPGEGLRKGTYLKMDGSFLEDEVFMNKIRSKWE